MYLFFGLEGVIGFVLQHESYYLFDFSADEIAPVVEDGFVDFVHGL
jgi:hypothetical protein